MNASFESKKQHKEHRTSMADSSSAIAYPSRTIVHAKLEMTSPGDLDEQEADAVANEVVSGGKIARKISGGGGSSGIAVSRQMESRLLQQQGGGQPMPSGLRSKMESSFGRDLSQVRLHTDSDAISMSSSIHARAFTFGNDIYFNNGQFSPETSAGQHLVAHELTHVMQGTGKVGREENEKPKFEPKFGKKDTIKRINGSELNNAFLSDVLLDAKILATGMVTRSIDILDKILNQGKYLVLFDYCFDPTTHNNYIVAHNKMINRLAEGEGEGEGKEEKDDRPQLLSNKASKKRVKKIKKQIITVQDNFRKILNALNTNEIDGQTLYYKLIPDWASVFMKFPSVENDSGFAFGYKDAKEALSKMDQTGRDTLVSLEEAAHDPTKNVTRDDFNSIFLRFSEGLNMEMVYNQKKGDFEKGVYDYKWKHRLSLACTIIHELSHRVCDTKDISYMKEGKEIGTVDLTNNASSYEIFTALVESTDYSLFNNTINTTEDGSGDKWNIDLNLYTAHGIPRI